ncbi:putative sulfate transporterc [mine drainage metagenome]|uniref:Putative sulfate transporterc n=1 Tax=mine drainage metagenome TaxID=410659 RepID=A0A1J5RMR8_9ZZZZ
MNILRKILPIWLIDYQRKNLVPDLTAGVIFTVLVIPQSLAYALLAGLPPQVGLYISIFPVIAYAIWGSSMVQAVGPVAITAIMTFTVLSPIALPGSPEYIILAASLSLISGALLLIFGVLRLGFLSQLLSRPVISGFISGASVLIVISQLKSLLGISTPSEDTWAILAALLQQLPHSHGATLVIGLSALVTLIFARYGLASILTQLGYSRERAAFVVRITPLLVVLISTVMVIHFNLDGQVGVSVVGSLVEGLPGFTFFLPSYSAIKTLEVPALLMAVIGMVQGISMAQALAIKRQERIDANAELVGLGASNLVAAFYGGMPTGGGVSRSAVNVASGAQTPLASIVSAIAMIVIVVGAAHWFARLPLAVLAANIVVAAISMVDIKAFRNAWAYDRADALSLLGAAFGVIIFGLEGGIVLGVSLSLATLLFRASIPHLAVVGRISGSEHFRNVVRHDVETLPGVLLLRIDESLFFGNLSAVESRITLELTKVPDIHEVVLIMSAVNMVDTTAMEVLTELNRDLAARGIRLHLAEIKGPVQDRLSHSPLWESLSGQVFFSANAAFEALLHKNDAAKWETSL